MSSQSSIFEYNLRELEYQSDQKNFQDIEIILDGLGSDGWDVAAAVPIVEQGKTVRILYCLRKHSRRSLI
ncbi:MAG TPA: hypothetical protein VGN23_07765 [Verrucomicrobiae bacterium]|jgi:hypothetical protein